jgi:hypothetical protein
MRLSRPCAVVARRSVTLVVLASLTSACVAWPPTTIDGPGIAPEDVPSQVRVTRSDGTTVVLIEAMLRADSIVGYEKSGVLGSVATSDVQMLEARQPSPVVVLIPALVVAAIVIPRVFLHSIRDDPEIIVPN